MARADDGGTAATRRGGGRARRAIARAPVQPAAAGPIARTGICARARAAWRAARARARIQSHARWLEAWTDPAPGAGADVNGSPGVNPLALVTAITRYHASNRHVGD